MRLQLNRVATLEKLLLDRVVHDDRNAIDVALFD
jgi:hypothetical protein